MRNLLKCLFAVALLFSLESYGHQQKTAISTVLFNPRTQNIEVMHRFYMHDAEHAVREIFGKDADILANTDTQKQFSEYVAQRFSLFNQKGESMLLSDVGFEVEGKFFWVYQETPQMDSLENMTVKHDALRELWPTQVNTVNVEGKGNIRTLTFDENTELLEVSFSHH